MKFFKPNKMMKKLKLFYVVILASLLSISCESIKTAAFDQYSYQKATEIKVESNHLIENATNPYGNYETEVEELLSDLDKIIEYEKNKPYNDVSLQLWQILSDDERNLLAGFLKRWKEKGQMSEVFVSEAKSQVMEAIDLIIQYEANKNKQSKEQLISLINNY
ncbi:hypothetical protein FVB9532_00478 [Mesonia oceanica]|uniref:Uncharacterized protein n=1 Tax=Mesonia oceanica TaxID=2687242 RepID=A0AC61Y429_9FLAO|nr:hypothetical protein FVB9532_00478 [Mesonia oceanica]|tara:strand:+ start:2490 stop:2978 length:489 start_codon:yes stop_codon:yes gene_type:complete